MHIKKSIKIAILAVLAFILIIYIAFQLANTKGEVIIAEEVISFEQCERAGFLIAESFPRQCSTPDGKVFIEESKTQSSTEGEIEISGEITCLPKKGSGPQTMECAIGLLGRDGKYYVLENLALFDKDLKYSQGGKKVDVYGYLSQKELTGTDGNQYDIAGSIRIEDIKELELQ